MLGTYFLNKKFRLKEKVTLKNDIWPFFGVLAISQGLVAGFVILFKFWLKWDVDVDLPEEYISWAGVALIVSSIALYYFLLQKSSKK